MIRYEYFEKRPIVSFLIGYGVGIMVFYWFTDIEYIFPKCRQWVKFHGHISVCFFQKGSDGTTFLDILFEYSQKNDLSKVEACVLRAYDKIKQTDESFVDCFSKELSTSCLSIFTQTIIIVTQTKGFSLRLNRSLFCEPGELLFVVVLPFCSVLLLKYRDDFFP